MQLWTKKNDKNVLWSTTTGMQQSKQLSNLLEGILIFIFTGDMRLWHMEGIWIKSSMRNICFGSQWTQRPRGPCASTHGSPTLFSSLFASSGRLDAGLKKKKKKERNVLQSEIFIGWWWRMAAYTTGACWHLLGVGLENGTAVSVGAGLMESTAWDFPYITHSTITGNQIKLLEHHLLSAGLSTIHNNFCLPKLTRADLI